MAGMETVADATVAAAYTQSTPSPGAKIPNLSQGYVSAAEGYNVSHGNLNVVVPNWCTVGHKVFYDSLWQKSENNVLRMSNIL